MLLDSHTQSAQQRQSSVAAIGSCFVVMALLSLFAVSSAFAQSEYGASMYTNSWIDASNSNAIKVVGWGMTEVPYYEMYHDAYVSTLVESPTGRRQWGWGEGVRSGGSPAVAMAESVMAWDRNDPGNYTVTSDHYSNCPSQYFGSTTTSMLVEYRKNAYRIAVDTNAGGGFGFGICTYDKTCNGVCVVNSFTSDKLYPGSCPGIHVQCETLFQNGVCVHDTRVCTAQNNAGVCDP